jgi:hypothetical protein
MAHSTNGPMAQARPVEIDQAKEFRVFRRGLFTTTATTHVGRQLPIIMIPAASMPVVSWS